MNMERLNLDKVKIMAAAATLAMFAGTACAHVELYAQVNKAYTQLWADRMDTGVFTDNNYSPSKLGVMSSAHLNKCTTFGGVIELELLPNNTRIVNQLITEDYYNHVVLVRKVDSWVCGGMWGKLSLGLGETASWNITNISFAGTNETSLGSSVANNGGGFLFNIAGANPVITDPTVNVVFNALNGVGDIEEPNGVLNTKDRVRYDSADFMGFKLSLSYGNTTRTFTNTQLHLEPYNFTRRNFFDVALRYMACWCDDFQVGAGIAGAWYNRDGVTVEPFSVAGAPYEHFHAWSGSIAVEHKPSGFNAAVAGGVKTKIRDALDNYKFWYIQLGKKFCFSDYGKTNFAIDYFQSKDAIVNGDKGKSWSIGVTQDLCKINSALYASYRHYKYDHTVHNYDDLNVLNLGVQFKFGAML